MYVISYSRHPGTLIKIIIICKAWHNNGKVLFPGKISCESLCIENLGKYESKR